MEGNLDKYFSKTRPEGHVGEGSGEAEAQVEEILTGLGVPWSRRPAGDIWEIESDVGDVMIGLNDDDSMLSIWSLIHPLDAKKMKKEANYFAYLLRVNDSTQGSCFAIADVGDTPWIWVIARQSFAGVNAESLSVALTDVFQSLKIYQGDESG